MTGNGNGDGRIERQARLRWVPLVQMRVNPLAQRELNQARVAQLAAAFDVEQLGSPTVTGSTGPPGGQRPAESQPPTTACSWSSRAASSASPSRTRSSSPDPTAASRAAESTSPART